MASQNQPASRDSAPDPARSYERAHPQNESGMGRLDNNKGAPEDRPDVAQGAVKNKQNPARQINGQDQSTGASAPAQPDHSMHEEEPLGADQRPLEAARPSDRRHPRTGGKGGTPDASDRRSQG